jgi:hypothetical protein
MVHSFVHDPVGGGGRTHWRMTFKVIYLGEHFEAKFETSAVCDHIDYFEEKS